MTQQEFVQALIGLQDQLEVAGWAFRGSPVERKFFVIAKFESGAEKEMEFSLNAMPRGGGQEFLAMLKQITAQLQRAHETGEARLEHQPMEASLTEHIIGYRVWALRGGIIGPVGIGWGPETAWPQKAEWLKARCKYGSHAAPAGRGCHCGVNAWHHPQPTWPKVSNQVYGAILAKGRVEVHHDGFRAEYAKVLCLGEGIKPRDVPVEETARKLGVPVVPFDGLVSFAREHGMEVPERMRPPRPSF